MLSHHAGNLAKRCIPVKRFARSLYRLSATDNEPENKRLETAQDWTEFQMDRVQRTTLIKLMEQYGSTQTRENTWTLRDSLRRPPAEATLSALLATGAHFGHAASIMNPNFMPYAYGVRAGITIIDMDRTLALLRRAVNLVRSVAHNRGQIVFVGTRADIRPVVEKAARRVGRQGYHVGERWLPGTLTNKFQMFGEETVTKNKVVPDLVILLNPLANMNAIRECAVEHVPTVGIIDSNADPRLVMYPIPANDESTRTAELIAGILSVAAREGIAIRQQVLHTPDLWEIDERMKKTIQADLPDIDLATDPFATHDDESSPQSGSQRGPPQKSDGYGWDY
ncbi:ribosomal protein S2 [Guyanagaster necrorhizus]|uniref:Ribosomal protein S2 n=1 Tax=Guyanagaster necrorhizus TaxID=856835 RepID=A0A9P7W4U9_9AGAR|nr:ribosomal protein S2 [Guyanagaster necrorhizus MCA 3950]KAG7452657.1 ribosomal protein S2 [Guyanagaster necrorhizus MCA 3950]